MPLRVSSEWSSDLMDAEKNAQHVKIKKPSHRELYEDAARILEELFAHRLEDQLPHYQHQTVRRPKVLFSTQGGQVPVDIFCEQGSLEDKRAYTLPSISRQLINQGLKQRDVNTLGRKTSDTQHSADAGSILSADNEGDISSVTDKRRKKTLFRKAKDRLLHAFHRQARERDADLRDDKSHAKGRSLKASSKHKGKEKKKGVVESVVRRLSTKKDNSDSSQSVRCEEKNGSQLPQKKIERHRNSAEIYWMNSLTISPKPRSPRPVGQSNITAASKIDRHKNSAGIDWMKPRSPRPFGQSNRSAASKIDRHKNSAGIDWMKPRSPRPVGQSNSTAAPDRHDRGLLVPPQWECCDSPSSPIPQSTSTESCHDSGNKFSSMHSLASAYENSSTSSKNVLDYPGEDIQFMDDDGRIRSRHDFGNDKRSGFSSPIHSPPPPRRLLGVGSAKSDTSDRYERCASGDVLFDNKTHEEKDKLYPKIAQRVFTIADGQQEEVDLEKLEKEIIECLRGKGDELSHKIDGPAEKLVEQTKAQTYKQFERTIQHSLGNEVSWNHLALLFYSTRAVVKAVGLSSDAAREVTKMTLRYFGDKFASWIIDQGGFETLVESDSELV